jgi:hypothetical protein
MTSASTPIRGHAVSLLRLVSSQVFPVIDSNECIFLQVGSLLYGIDSGIVSTVIAQPEFQDYFAPFTRKVAHSFP